MSVLCIIGNGFDIFHQLPSKFDDFGDYLKKINEDKYNDLVDSFDFGPDDWSNFEEQLSKLNPTRAYEENEHYLVSYNSDNWRTSYNHDFQEGVDDSVGEMYSFIYMNFKTWIKQLGHPFTQKFTLPSDAKFLTFNYTLTLEKTYYVDPEKILHIHGKTGDDDLILGHSWDVNSEDDSHDEDTDVRIIEATERIRSHIRNSKKKVKEALENNASFFRDLRSVKKIFVLGHSMSEVDIPYYKEIIKNIDLDQVEWHISYYQEPEKSERLKTTESLGIPSQCVHLHEMENIFCSK